jgi:hypothetical protein
LQRLPRTAILGRSGPSRGTSAFRDVKTGDDDANMWPPACQASTTQCIAKTGYDLPTGTGTPQGIGGF